MLRVRETAASPLKTVQCLSQWKKSTPERLRPLYQTVSEVAPSLISSWSVGGFIWAYTTVLPWKMSQGMKACMRCVWTWTLKPCVWDGRHPFNWGAGALPILWFTWIGIFLGRRKPFAPDSIRKASQPVYRLMAVERLLRLPAPKMAWARSFAVTCLTLMSLKQAKNFTTQSPIRQFFQRFIKTRPLRRKARPFVLTGKRGMPVKIGAMIRFPIRALRSPPTIPPR